MMIKGGPMGKIRGHHCLKGDTKGVLQWIHFKGNVRIFKEGPAELVGCHDHVGQTFLFLESTIECDMGHGELSDFGFASGFMIDI